ncbi:MAG: hypothetical protein J1F05_07050 [Muribaculaceae bacterium]|nr:hypothetical protein [Muribaculaceae bacterium]
MKKALLLLIALCILTLPSLADNNRKPAAKGEFPNAFPDTDPDWSTAEINFFRIDPNLPETEYDSLYVAKFSINKQRFTSKSGSVDGEGRLLEYIRIDSLEHNQLRFSHRVNIDGVYHHDSINVINYFYIRGHKLSSEFGFKDDDGNYINYNSKKIEQGKLQITEEFFNALDAINEWFVLESTSDIEMFPINLSGPTKFFTVKGNQGETIKIEVADSTMTLNFSNFPADSPSRLILNKYESYYNDNYSNNDLPKSFTKAIGDGLFDGNELAYTTDGELLMLAGKNKNNKIWQIKIDPTIWNECVDLAFKRKILLPRSTFVKLKISKDEPELFIDVLYELL